MSTAAIALALSRPHPRPDSVFADAEPAHEQAASENEREAMAGSLTALRAQMATVVEGGRTAGAAWPTGVRELDAALGGGVPRGRITEVVGTLGAGKTSLVRQLVARVLAEGGWVAWVDARRTLAPQEWAGLGERLVMVRPRDHTRGAWCADLLLRSGVFALVVLDGAPVLSRVVGVRLAQLARERDAAFVVMGEGTQASRFGGAVRLRVCAFTPPAARVGNRERNHERNHERNRERDHRSRRRTREIVVVHADAFADVFADVFADAATRGFSVLVEKGGSYRTVEVSCAVVVARRVCTDSEVPDRRGVARRTRHAWAPRVNSDPASVAAVERNERVARQERTKRRAAESTYGRPTRREQAREFLAAREQQQPAAPPRETRRETSREPGRESTREPIHESSKPASRQFGQRTLAALGHVPAGVG